MSRGRSLGRAEARARARVECNKSDFVDGSRLAAHERLSMVRSPISSMPQDIPLVGTGWELSSETGTRLPARVPNDISDDLEQAGLLPPLFYGTNSMFGGNWTLNRTWTLSRNISLPRVRAGASGVLRFEGVDYNASIRINGKLVATHVGAFEPFEVVLSSHDLRVQTLSLAVTLHPPPSSVTWPF